MNPLKAFATSSLEISPSLMAYEVGSEIELVLYNYLKFVADEYVDIFIVSFFDAHKAFFSYLKRVLGDESSILNKCELIPVYSKKESERIEGSTPVVLGSISKRIGKASKKTLAVLLGLDFYSVVFGENSFAQFYPRIVNLGHEVDVTIVLNTKLFSERVLQVIDSFSFNIAKLGIEERDGKLERYILLLRTVFLEYNLQKWYYKIDKGEIVFYQ